MRDHRRKVFLITNSDFNYTKVRKQEFVFHTFLGFLFFVHVQIYTKNKIMKKQMDRQGQELW